MPEYVPFIFGKNDVECYTRVFGDAPVVRIQLSDVHKLDRSIPQEQWLWVDPGLDEVNNYLDAPKYVEEWKANAFYPALNECNWLFSRVHHTSARKNGSVRSGPAWKVTSSALSNPDMLGVTALTKNIVRRILALPKVAWISVPHVGVHGSAGIRENSLNLALGAATASAIRESSAKRSYHLIQPLILKSKTQYDTSKGRNALVKLLKRLMDASGAAAAWVVDQSLDDWNVSTKSANRIGSLVELHQKIKDEVGNIVVAAGPYWITGLLLWARGLVSAPVVGIGSRYKYHWPCSPMGNSPTLRVAVPPLRRLVKCKPPSRAVKWLKNASTMLTGNEASGSNSVTEMLAANQASEASLPKDAVAFANLATQVADGFDAGRSKYQIAQFHREWIKELEKTSAVGRPVLLFQQLTQAYALGKYLGQKKMAGPLPGEDTKLMGQPEAIAQLYMDFVL